MLARKGNGRSLGIALRVEAFEEDDDEEEEDGRAFGPAEDRRIRENSIR